ALGVVITVSFLVGLFILTPDDLKRLAATSLTSIVGVSNIYLWGEYSNYFASNSAEAVLLHTWSLGVEEQFYMVWPIALMIVYRLWRRAAFPIMLVLTIMMAVFSEYAVGVAASASYFLSPMRFFELMIGACLAELTKKKGVREE